MQAAIVNTMQIRCVIILTSGTYSPNVESDCCSDITTEHVIVTGIQITSTSDA